ncbi:tetratricopeptide repeat protein 28-like [Montipora foliosa]|uniref:tetratricopeptide repeat protein 28-like n=1 Tax=Montipora foliosa TaxID=591990 RepID=UPI0035F13846
MVINLKKSSIGIPQRCIKLEGNYISETPAMIFNKSLLQGIVSDVLKVSKVIPVDKEGAPHISEKIFLVLTIKMVDRKLNVLERHLRDRGGKGLACFKLGNYYADKADFNQAITNYTEALVIFKEIGFRAGEGGAYGNLGNAYQGLGNFKQAIAYHNQRLSIAKEVGDRSAEGKAYCNLGNAYHGLGNVKQAIEYHNQYLTIAKEVGDRTGEGIGYCNLGTDYKSLGSFKQAMEYHNQELTIAKEVGDRAGEGRAYGNLGNAYQGLGNFKQAIAYHNQCLSIAKEVGDRAREGGAYGNLGNASQGLGNFTQAIAYHNQHLSIAKKVGDRAGERGAYVNLGNAYQSLGNFKQAIEYYNQHLGIAKKVGDRVGAGKAYGNLCCAYRSLGNFKQAIEYQNQCLSIAKEVGDRATEGKAYNNLGNVYDSLGNFKQAIEYHHRYLSIAKEVGDRAGEGAAYGNLGSTYKSLGACKEAIEYHNQDLCIAKEVGNRAGEGAAYGNLGNAYQSLGDFQQAIAYHNQDLCIAKEVGNRAGEGGAYGNLGHAYQCLGDFKQALAYHNQHLSICKETENPIRLASSCYDIAVLHDVFDSFSKALNYYRLSIHYFEETRRLLQAEDAWKISFRDKNRFAYTALWTALLRNGEVDEALHAAEQGRAQTLVDILRMQYGVDEKFTMEETSALVMKDLPSQTVFKALQGNTINFWLLREDIAIHFRQKKIKNGSADSLIKRVFQQINAETVVQCENRSLDTQRSDFSSGRKAVEETVQSLSVSVHSLQPLYDVLVSPIEDLLQGDDLIFVPDGPFGLAPFSALSDSVRIRAIPSLTTLKLIASAPDDFQSRNEALLVGDPCLKQVTYGTGEPIYGQLPCAKKEVDMIGELLQTTPLTGKNATKGEVMKRMKSVGLIHIAAHGDDEFGEIALAPNPERTSQIPEEEDYVISLSDVHAVRIQARLVVLSCCHSGQGEVKSEGIVGIARAFLCAGAQSVLVSLWAIDDEATLIFMKNFYQHLAERKSASTALHHAMKSLRGTKKYSALKYWAPFVLIGDDVTFEFGQHKHKKNETMSNT